MTTESSITTSQRLMDALKAFLAPDAAASAQALIAAAFKVQLRAHQPADSNIYLAGANILAAPNTIAGNVAYVHTLTANTPMQMKISSFKATAGATVTSAATHFATWQLVYNNGNGGSDTVIATGNTTAIAFVANTPLSISVTAANALVPANSCVQVKVTKSGSNGKELPCFSYEADAGYDGATG